MEAKLERWGNDLVIRLSEAAARHLGVSEGEQVVVRRRVRSASEGDAAAAPEPAPSRRRNADGVPLITIEEMIAEAERLGPAFEPPSIDWGPDRGSEIIDDDVSR